METCYQCGQEVTGVCQHKFKHPDDFQHLVQLSTFPRSAWTQKIVYHPSEQRGNVPIWHVTDEDRQDAAASGYPIPDDEILAHYDVGIPVSWENDDDDFYHQVFDFTRVRIKTFSGYTLEYRAFTLWCEQ